MADKDNERQQPKEQAQFQHAGKQRRFLGAYALR